MRYFCVIAVAGHFRRIQMNTVDGPREACASLDARVVYGWARSNWMDVIWIFCAFWIGSCAGFGLFALLQMSRDASRELPRQPQSMAMFSDLEADTLTRF